MKAITPTSDLDKTATSRERDSLYASYPPREALYEFPDGVPFYVAEAERAAAKKEATT